MEICGPFESSIGKNFQRFLGFVSDKTTDMNSLMQQHVLGVLVKHNSLDISTKAQTLRALKNKIKYGNIESMAIL